MKKAVSYLWRAAAVAAALFLIAAALAPFILGRLFPPARIRALIASEAKQKINRDVKIGSVGWSLIHGVTIKDFAVSERPDFSAGTFLSLDSLSVRVRLLALLHRRLAVASLTVQNPEVSVIGHKNGTFNFSDIFSTAPKNAAGKAASGAAAASAKPFSYAAGKILISGGRLEYRNEAAGETMEISGLDADIRHFQMIRPFAASLSAAFAVKKGGQTRQGTVSFDGDVGLGGGNPGQMEFKFRKAAASFLGWGATLSGDAQDLESPKFDIQADVARDGAQIADGRLSGSAVFSEDHEVKQVRADVDLKSPGFNAADLKLSGLPKDLSVPPLSLAGRIDFAKGILGLSGVSVASPQVGNVNIEGSIAGVASGKWNPNLNIAAHLSAPRIKASAITLLPRGVPSGLIIPAFVLDAKAALSGADANISVFNLKTDYGTVEISGAARRLWSAPEPDLNVAAELSIPELRAAQLPFPDVPRDFVLPASRWDAALHIASSQIDVKSLRAVVGDNDLEVSGNVSQWRQAGRTVKAMLTCRRFVLGEIAPLVPSLAPLHLAGSGFFVLAARGPLTDPFLAGKMKFQGLSGDFSGLKFAGFGGIATFDAQRIDIPNLDGSFGSGELQANLTLEDYATPHPAVDVQAELSKLDLGQLLAAVSSSAAAAQKPSAAARPSPKGASTKLFAKAKGQLTIDELTHPNIKAEDVRLYWNLSGIGSDLSKLNGWARIKVSGGRFDGLGDLADESNVVKVLTFPFLVFQKIGNLGGIRLFPNFDHIAFFGLNGDYAFRNGVMTVKDSRFSSEVADLDAQGTIDLPAQKLDLTMNTQLAGLAPFPVEVSGSFDKPKVHARLGQLLVQPAKQIIQGLFGR
ncbi:MAG TPA: AsmA-like C-terminal region-containing protein [Elusimicrobiota bacterium]|nr:AsmA-like C-terminal region-containing protein [Elusimicrobiota bacterium]